MFYYFKPLKKHKFYLCDFSWLEKFIVSYPRKRYHFLLSRWKAVASVEDSYKWIYSNASIFPSFKRKAIPSIQCYVNFKTSGTTCKTCSRGFRFRQYLWPFFLRLLLYYYRLFLHKLTSNLHTSNDLRFLTYTRFIKSKKLSDEYYQHDARSTESKKYGFTNLWK